jgi:hypothetical protein
VVGVCTGIYVIRSRDPFGKLRAGIQVTVSKQSILVIRRDLKVTATNRDSDNYFSDLLDFANLIAYISTTLMGTHWGKYEV